MKNAYISWCYVKRYGELCMGFNPLLYHLLFKITALTLRTITADPKHLGAKIGATAVLHTWGSALTHHPHIHCIVPGGGLNPNNKWIACKRGFFLPIKVLSRLFKRLFLEQLMQLHPQHQFYGSLKPLICINLSRVSTHFVC